MNISISRIKLFKACRRAYYLKYIEDLEPVEQATALATGSNYHSKLEELYNTGDVDTSDFSKESAMAVAYKKYIYPQFSVDSVEDWIEKEIAPGFTLIGRADGIAKDGYLVEHKTTSMEVTEEYEYNLQWDEQILAYMWMTGSRKVHYTVCRKPTIRQKKNESDEEFFERMVAWYDEDTESKLRLLEVIRTDEEIQQFEDSVLYLLKDIQEVQDDPDKTAYRNTCHCHMWGRRCEYSSICLSYDPNQEYVEFTRGGRT